MRVAEDVARGAQRLSAFERLQHLGLSQAGPELRGLKRRRDDLRRRSCRTLEPTGTSTASVHFVERKNNIRRVPGTQGEWESGYWVIAEDTAQRLIGADLYLHSGQSEPSHFGGTRGLIR